MTASPPDSAGSAGGPLSSLRRRIVGGVIVLVALIVVAVAYAVVLRSFDNETDADSHAIHLGPRHLSQGIEIAARTVSVSTSARTAEVRFTFKARGSILNDRQLVAKEIQLESDGTIDGLYDHIYKPGDDLIPVTLTVPLTNGFQGRYPFDDYSAVLDIAFFDNDYDFKRLPTNLTVYPVVHGFGLNVVKSSGEDNHQHVELRVRRSASTRFFSIFLIATMWALTIGVLVMVVRVLVFGRKLEFFMLEFLAVLLFAFPSIRGAQPSIPDVGVKSDYLSFFWCEGLVILALIALFGTWLARRRYD